MQVVPIEGAVESWMTNVQAEMRRTLYQITKEGVFFYAKSPRTKWIETNLGMVRALPLAGGTFCLCPLGTMLWRLRTVSMRGTC